ncbi:hypothetical protein PFISCL1PPCAC_4200 [Pristionchus fissidentatus]|uniref:F-box domain-containing protein n=1 Tax=Pristionchus fissidentatus TaxID=1538716 RepID=A0AAV5V1I1_9BILA|nr:hypothetical protein PFISCL1PPCAC_4200 [Pristionchus fissidentatus]
MSARRENIIREPDTFLIEHTNKSKLNTFTQPAEWANNDHLSQLPEGVLREIFAFLNRFDLSIVRRVNQTLHYSIGKCWSKLAKNGADKLTVYQV